MSDVTSSVSCNRASDVFSARDFPFGMFQKTLLAASPSSFGSRYERSQKLSPHVYGSSLEDSRRSSLDYAGNNAVSFPSSLNSKPLAFKEKGTRTTPAPTVGFAPPLEANVEATNNGLQRRPSPGLLSLTLSEDVHSHPLVPEQSWSLEKLQEEYAVFSRPVVVSAYEVAKRAHMGQLRKSGEPVLSHCVETAKILADIDADDHIVAAALLHDVVDDTQLTVTDLTSMVSSEVVELVKTVSKLSYVSQLVREGSVEDGSQLKDVLIASVDCRAVLIKMADRIHNMRTASALTPMKRRQWATETMELFVPLAGRLGCWGIKSELEDLCFEVLYPKEYSQLKSNYEARVAQFTEGHLQDVLNRLKAALDEHGIECEDISGRPKNLYGVWKKMEKRGYDRIDQVTDLFALRVVVKDGQSCHDALQTVNGLWSSLPDKLKDYVTHPKPNGYRSIHCVCLIDDMPLEIQIRTTKMHYIAEYGVAAHWRYKEATDRITNTAAEFIEHQTLWSRYILGCLLELNDQKLRPDDLEDNKTVLQSIWTTFWSFEDRRCGMVSCQHSSCCVLTSASTIQVMVKDARSVQVCQVKMHCTLESFLLEHCGRIDSDGHVPLVNGEIGNKDEALQFGDVIEFSNALAFDRHRQQLSTIVPFEGSCRDPALPY